MLHFPSICIVHAVYDFNAECIQSFVINVFVNTCGTFPNPIYFTNYSVSCSRHFFFFLRFNETYLFIVKTGIR